MWGEYFMKYDVIIIGAGPGGIFSAYELMKKAPDLKVAVFEEGNTLEKRKCPIDGKNIKSCIKCPTCAIMNGFGGAGAFSDGKYNITNDFGGTLYEYIGKNYLNNQFAGHNFNDYSELVLGCTHFNYFKDSFAKLFPDDIEIIDGNIGVSNYLKNILIKNGVLDNNNDKLCGTVEYYYSGRAVDDKELEHIKMLHRRLEVMRKI